MNDADSIDTGPGAVTQQSIEGLDTEGMFSRLASGVRPSFYVYQKRRLKRYEIAEGESIFKIGRGEDCDIVIDDPAISSEQLIVVKLGDYCYFMDCGTQDCVSFNGVRKRQESAPAESRMLIKVGKFWIVYLGIDAVDYLDERESVVLKRSLVMGDTLEREAPQAELLIKSEYGEWATSKAPILVGSHSTCDYRIDGPGIEPFHFMLYFNPQGAFVEDLTQGSPGIKVDGIKCIGAKPVSTDVTIDISNFDIYVYVYGNIKERCETLFSDFNNKTDLMLTALSPEDLDPIVLPFGNKRLKVGRNDECDITIEHPSVSREHAYIIVREKCFHLADNHSSNKCFVNLKPIEKSTVRPGDIIEFGHASYLVHYAL